MSVVRRLIRALVLTVLILVGATAAAVVVSQTAWFRQWLRGFVVAQAGTILNGQLSVERLDGNLFYGVKLTNVQIAMDGRPVVSMQDVELAYNVFQMMTRGISVDAIHLDRPTVYLTKDDQGWTIARLIKPSAPDAPPSHAPAVRVDQATVTGGAVVIDDPHPDPSVNLPNRIDEIEAALSLDYASDHTAVDVTRASLHTSNPELTLRTFSGAVTLDDETIAVRTLALQTERSALTVNGTIEQYRTAPRLALEVASTAVSLPELGRVWPSLAKMTLEPSFSVSLAGSLDALRVEADVRSTAGQIAGTLTADIVEPGYSAAGNLSVRHLDLAPLLADAAQKSDITADATVDVAASSLSAIDTVSGTVSMNARIAAAGYVADRLDLKASLAGRTINLNGRAFAYGANVTAAGRVVVPQADEPLAFDLKGRAAHLNLRTLPRAVSPTPAQTDISADYHAAGSEPLAASSKAARRVDLDATFLASAVPGVHLEEGSSAHVALRGADLAYNADATLKEIDLQQIGDAFAVPALNDERYTSAIDVHVIANGSGTTPATMTLTVNGEVTNAAIMGGHISDLAFDAALDHDRATVKMGGQLAGFDPAVVSGRSAAAGQVGGRIDLQAAIDGVSTGVTLDNVVATARATIEQSSVGGVVIEHAAVDGDYRDRTATIRQLEVVGRDVNLTASGALALNDSGQSDLTFHADSSRLEALGRIVELPLAGIARVEGRVTGNQTDLKAEGTVEGDGLKYEENGALSIRSAYVVQVPDLTFARAQVEAETHATFVTVAGQNVNEVEAKTTYADQQLTFDASASQPQRSVAAAGTVTLHPDHQEIHLDRLTLQAGNQQWAVAEGERPAITYGQNALGVENLRLVSGDQAIVANGRFGGPGDSLDVQLSNVDLAAVDALMLRPPQFSGRLDASSVIAGTTDAPSVKGKFNVVHGGFRQFSYETLGGSVEYADQGVTLDARLQQDAAQWISAKGYIPTALFTASTTEGGTAPTADAPAASGAPLDLTIDSSPLGLGLIQGLTTEVTGVQGTLEAHVRVTGTADDPQPSGAITVADGAMTVALTGVTYSHIAGKVDIQNDRLHIDQITLLDDHQSALSITGNLPLRARGAGGVRLWINAEDFKVLGNKMGDLRIQTAMEVSGHIRAPEIRGYLGVSTGRVDLDELMALAGPSAYATSATQYLDATTGAAAPAAQAPEPAAPSFTDGLSMNVRLTVPNDLVIKADSLQAPGASVALGALNVTLGGDLTAMKDRGGPFRLAGAVNTVRGTYEFQGRRFEILRDGTVRFDGSDQLNPVLDIRTRREIQGVEALVGVRGTISRPQIVMTSTPPLDEADILALIVFNQPINQLGEGQQASLASRAQALATGAVAGQIAQSIGNALNLDTFEIEMAPDSGSAAELTFGQQIGRDLYVKVEQGVGDQNSTNVVVEYAFTNWLRLQTNVLQGGSSSQQSLFRRHQGSGADLIFLFTK
jgi:translocation and assembly module TamB